MMIKIYTLGLVLGMTYQGVIVAGTSDEQIKKMYELQVEQSIVSPNTKSRAEKNKIPEFKQKLLDAERELDRADRLYVQEENYQNELRRLDLEARRLRALVDETIVKETDFTFGREKKKLELQLKRLEIESRLLDLEKQKQRVAAEEKFIAAELNKKSVEIASESALQEANRDIATGLRASLEGLGEGARNGKLFD